MERMVRFVKKYICNTKLGDWLINQIRIRGIDAKLFDVQAFFQYKKDFRTPTQEMKAARVFFEKNEERIEKNLSYLYDCESRETYLQAIEYRQTHNSKKAPKYTKEKYFVKDIFTFSDHEVFIDGGSFVGDTVKEFIKLQKSYKKIICFEPDKYNYKMLERINAKNIVKFNLGLWNEKSVLKFFNNGSVGSKITDLVEEKTIEIEVDCIDNLQDCEDATFIKMDVEGAELQALEGAKNTILRNKPKLAICLYHSDSDMIEIIEYIHLLVPEYKMYVRHHSPFAGETVLYATI